MKPIDEFNGMLAQTFLPLFGIDPDKKDSEKEPQQPAASQKGPFDDLPFFNMWKEQQQGSEGTSDSIYAVGMCIKKSKGQPDGTGKKFEVISLDADSEPFKLGVRKGDVLHQVGIIEVKSLSEQELSELVQHTLSLGEKLRMIFKVAEENKKDGKSTLEILVQDHARKAAEAKKKTDDGAGAGEYV